MLTFPARLNALRENGFRYAQLLGHQPDALLNDLCKFLSLRRFPKQTAFAEPPLFALGHASTISATQQAGSRRGMQLLSWSVTLKG